MQHTKVTMNLVSRKYRSLYKQLLLLRRFSAPATATVSDVSNPSPVCYCDKQPIDHTIEDYKKFYTISKTDYDGVFANVIPRRFNKLCKAIDENKVLIREPALTCIDIIKDSQAGSIPKIILDGPKGGGKSLALLHVMQYCLQKNMVIVNVPNASVFVDSQNRKPIQQATWNSSRVDQPVDAIEWLKLFKFINPNFLMQAKTTQEYQWGTRESTEKDKPLMDVVDKGTSRNMYATDAVGVLLKEIRLNNDWETLYAVDAVNCFFGGTSYTLETKPVETDQLSLIHHFKKLLNPEYSLKRGAYVVAISQSAHYLPYIRRMPKFFFDSQKHEMSVMEQLFDTEALSRLSDFMNVDVPYYNEEEFIIMMNFYSEQSWLAREMTDQLIKEIRFMTNRIPTNVQDILGPL